MSGETAGGWQAPSAAEQIMPSVERWFIQAQGQIQAWHQDWDNHLAAAERTWERAGMEIREVQSWDSGPALLELPKADPEAFVAEKQEALETISEDLAWRQWTQTPTYQREAAALAQEAYEARGTDPRIDEAIDRVTSPEYLGEQAEQRFYAEHDPQSEWYREDLYHGEPGPDVIAEHMEAVLNREEETSRIEIDTTAPSTDATWQAQLAELDARLEELGRVIADIHPDRDAAERFGQAEDDFQRHVDATEGQTGPPSREERLEEIATQIDAIHARLDGLEPYEDWSNPGRYYGQQDDELETRLYGQLQRLEAQREALEQGRPARGDDYGF